MPPLPLSLLNSRHASGRTSVVRTEAFFGFGGGSSSPPAEGTTYTLKGSKTLKLSDSQVIGGRRSPEVDIVLPLDGVSGVHCKIEAVRGGVKVTDLGSTNGTTINGRQVMPPAPFLPLVPPPPLTCFPSP